MVVQLVFKKKAFNGLDSIPFFGRAVTIFRVILPNEMFFGGKMTIYINFSD